MKTTSRFSIKTSLIEAEKAPYESFIGDRSPVSASGLAQIGDRISQKSLKMQLLLNFWTSKEYNNSCQCIDMNGDRS